MLEGAGKALVKMGLKREAKKFDTKAEAAAYAASLLERTEMSPTLKATLAVVLGGGLASMSAVLASGADPFTPAGAKALGAAFLTGAVTTLAALFTKAPSQK